jgi:hypothetical protein
MKIVVSPAEEREAKDSIARSQTYVGGLFREKTIQVLR